MLNQILKVFLVMDLAGSLFILVFWLYGKVARKWLRATWQYAVYVLTIILLLIPLSIPLSKVVWKEVSWLKPSTYYIQVASDSKGVSELKQDEQSISVTDADEGGQLSKAFSEALFYLAPLWLGGVLIFFGLQFFSAWRFYFFISKTSRKLSGGISVGISQEISAGINEGHVIGGNDKMSEGFEPSEGYESHESIERDKSAERNKINRSIDQIFEDCKKQLHIRRNIELFENPLIGVPILCGFLKPRVIVPKMKLSEEGWRHVFLHELTHLKRWDLWLKSLALLANGLHWFNPLSYFLFRNIHKACELSCDESVTKDMQACQRKAYGMTILKVLEYTVESRRGFYFALCDSKKNICQRLALIAHSQESHKSAKLLLLTALCFCFLFSATVSAALLPPSEVAEATSKSKLEDGVYVYALTLDNGHKVNLGFSEEVSPLFFDSIVEAMNTKDWSHLSKEYWTYIIEFGIKQGDDIIPNFDLQGQVADEMTKKIQKGLLEPYAPSSYVLTELPEDLSYLKHIKIFDINNALRDNLPASTVFAYDSFYDESFTYQVQE